jgi:glucokinase
MMSKRYICLDIGGTKVLGAVFDEKKNIIYKVKKKTKVEKGLEKIEETIFKVVDDLVSEAKLDKNDLAAISAGAPGVIDQNKGEIIYAPNLPWKNYNIRNIVEDRYKVPFYIGNDVNVGVMGEWKYGAGIKKKNIVGLFVGTGVGGGLIIDNKLYTGSRFAAAEMGHMVLNTEGPYCNCGQKGCLEAYTSKIAMAREIRTQLERGRQSVLKEIMEDNMSIFKSKELRKAVDSKDDLAIEVVDRAVYYLAAGAGSLINIFNPEMFILGGGVLEALGDYIMPVFKNYIKRFAWRETLEAASIVQSALGDDAVVYGALAMIMEKVVD